MSGQLRQLKNRIRSVENTKKITHAMEMISAAKLHRFQGIMLKARPYAHNLAQLLERLIEDDAGKKETAKKSRPSLESFHPFFEKRAEKRTALVLMTSDTGLCGSYNLDLIHEARNFIGGAKNKPLLVGVGKSGIKALERRGHDFNAAFTDIKPGRLEEIIGNVTRVLEKLYLSGEADAVYVIYMHILSLTGYERRTEKILPLENSGASAAEAEKKSRPDYLYEPSREFLFRKLVPAYFEAKVRTLFLESFVAEQIARMTAMHLATENAEEMINTLVLRRNKARQAAITKEIIEIVSGAQALKKQN